MRKDLKILVWSDLHAHPWQESERPDRWLDCLSVVREVRKLARANSVDTIVFCGDLFEAKRTVRTEIMAPLIQELIYGFWKTTRGGTPQVIPTFYVAGNHDFYGGGCTLKALAEVGNAHLSTRRVIAKRVAPTILPLGDWTCVAMPYGCVVDADLGYDVLFSHNPVGGATLVPGIVENPQSFDRMLDATGPGGRLAVLNGHYHIPQTITQPGCIPVTCVGSPYSLSWRDLDTDQERGCVLLELTDRTSPAVKITRLQFEKRFPRFYKEGDLTAVEGDFVQPDLSAITTEGTAEVHENIEGISSGIAARALSTYLLQEQPDLTGRDFAKWLTVGLRLLRGEAKQPVKE